VLPRRSASLVMGLAVTSLAATSLAAMFATSQLLAESVDRPAPRRLQPLVPDLGSMGTIQVEPPSGPRSGRPPAGGKPPAAGAPPPRQPAADRPPQPPGAGVIVVVQHQPVRTVVQKVVQVIRVPAVSPSRPRPARRHRGHHQLSWRRWVRPPHRDRPDDPPRREEDHRRCPDDPPSDDGHDDHDGHGRRDGRHHDEGRHDQESRADRQSDPRGGEDPEPAARDQEAEAPGDEPDQGRDRQPDDPERDGDRSRQDDRREGES
jgi:hypothetical protein